MKQNYLECFKIAREPDVITGFAGFFLPDFRLIWNRRTRVMFHGPEQAVTSGMVVRE